MDHTKTAMKEKRREEEKGWEVWAQNFPGPDISRQPGVRSEDGLMGLIAIQMLRSLAYYSFLWLKREEKERKTEEADVQRES